MLAPAQAIAFPGHFQVADGKIVAAESAAAPEAAPEAAAQESRAAERWYINILAKAFNVRDPNPGWRH
jgi:hypothetical protein